MIFKIQQDGLICFGAVIVDDCLLLRKNKNLKNVNLKIFLEQTNFNFMKAQSRMF